MVVLNHTRIARSLTFLRNFLLPSTSKKFTVLSSNVDQKIDSVDEVEDVEEAKLREAEIEKKRNKSKLEPEDYNIQHEIGPFIVTEKTRLIDRRRAYGKLGKASGVDPALLWHTKEELAFAKEYESVLQPHTIQQLIELNQEQKKQKENELIKMQEEILNKVANIDKTIVEFHKKWALKKQKADALLMKKEKLVEEVRKHFGYTVDPRDRKFKTMLLELQEKEKKEKKANKKMLKKQAPKIKLDSEEKESGSKMKSSEET